MSDTDPYASIQRELSELRAFKKAHEDKTYELAADGSWAEQIKEACDRAVGRFHELEALLVIAEAESAALREERDRDDSRSEREGQEVQKGFDRLQHELAESKAFLVKLEELARYQHEIDWDRLNKTIRELELVRRRSGAYREALHDTINRLMISGPGISQQEADALYLQICRDVDAAGQGT